MHATKRPSNGWQSAGFPTQPNGQRKPMSADDPMTRVLRAIYARYNPYWGDGESNHTQLRRAAADETTIRPTCAGENRKAWHILFCSIYTASNTYFPFSLWIFQIGSRRAFPLFLEVLLRDIFPVCRQHRSSRFHLRAENQHSSPTVQANKHRRDGAPNIKKNMIAGQRTKLLFIARRVASSAFR